MPKTVPVRLVATFTAYSDHAEHMGFVAYAFCELFRAETLLHYCILWLVVTGALTVLRNDLPRPRR